jgi:hypothetical protein
MKWVAYFIVSFLLSLPQLRAQEYAVSAVDAQSGKPLHGVPIVLRYACTFTGSGAKTKQHCKFIHRSTGRDGMVHFPEAGSLTDIDAIFPSSAAYAEVGCDIVKPTTPGMGTMKFKRRSFGQMLYWVILGD